jgi:hypothetical protein
MIQRRSGARFLLKTANQFLIAGSMRGQELQCDLTAKTDVEGEIDLAHATGADAAKNTIVAKRLSDTAILRLRDSCRFQRTWELR